MRTVPGSEIIGSAELRRREHKKKRKKRKKERKKERKKSKREEIEEGKGGGAYNLC